MEIIIINSKVDYEYKLRLNTSLYLRKFPVTCGRTVVLLSMNYSEVSSTNKTKNVIK